MTTTVKNIKLPSNKSSVRSLEPILAEIRKIHNIDENKFYNVMIAVTEAVNNAIIHGNKLCKEKEVLFNIEADHNKIIITVQDEGEGFDPNTVDDCLVPENLLKDGGRGVFLIRELMDEVEFLDTGKGTKIKMVFHHNQ
jgi:serine/threonine-protein kinase RsbW